MDLLCHQSRPDHCYNNTSADNKQAKEKKESVSLQNFDFNQQISNPLIQEKEKENKKYTD